MLIDCKYRDLVCYNDMPNGCKHRLAIMSPRVTWSTDQMYLMNL